MNKLFYASVLMVLAVVFNAYGDDTASAENNELTAIFGQLKVEQGLASFTQNKHFSFLSTPMRSSGTIKVHQGNIIWQVESPVFSKQVIMGEQIWQLEQQGSNNYLPVVSHSSIENLVKAIFSGEVDQSQWQIALAEQQCLQFKPNDAILAKAISQLEVCLLEDSQHRKVSLIDAQNNLTEIIIHFTRNTLTDDEISEFNVNS